VIKITRYNDIIISGILYVKDNINVSRRCDLHFDDLEGIWVQIKINGKHILFGIFYIHPKKIYEGNWNRKAITTTLPKRNQNQRPQS
jgi:hypothetical protein